MATIPTKAIEKRRKEMLADCWEYHGKMIKSDYSSLTKSGLLDHLFDLDLTEYEDVGYFVGYLRALDDMQNGDIK